MKTAIRVKIIAAARKKQQHQMQIILIRKLNVRFNLHLHSSWQTQGECLTLEPTVGCWGCGGTCKQQTATGRHRHRIRSWIFPGTTHSEGEGKRSPKRSYGSPKEPKMYHYTHFIPHNKKIVINSFFFFFLPRDRKSVV